MRPGRLIKDFLLLNIAFGGDWGGAQGIDNSIVSAKFYIDYVRVYQKAENGPVLLSVSSTPGGKVIIDPQKTDYLSGDKVIVLADRIPDIFQSWTGDYHSTSNPFSFVIGNTSLKANSVPKVKWSLTVTLTMALTPGVNGVIRGHQQSRRLGWQL